MRLRPTIPAALLALALALPAAGCGLLESEPGSPEEAFGRELLGLWRIQYEHDPDAPARPDLYYTFGPAAGSRDGYLLERVDSGVRTELSVGTFTVDALDGGAEYTLTYRASRGRPLTPDLARLEDEGTLVLRGPDGGQARRFFKAPSFL